MATDTVSLFTGWKIDSLLSYSLSAVAIALVIRLISSLLKANEVHFIKKAKWADQFSKAFRGFGSAEPKADDYWHTFVLGCMELHAFPILMFTGRWEYVGAWIGFKAIAQFRWWGAHRAAFNRFLIGMALVVFGSYWLAKTRFSSLGCASPPNHSYLDSSRK